MPFGIGTIAMIGGGAIAAVGFISIALGFGTVGIVAGSIAAATQSSIGAVAAGSTFATMSILHLDRSGNSNYWCWSSDCCINSLNNLMAFVNNNK